MGLMLRRAQHERAWERVSQVCDNGAATAISLNKPGGDTMISGVKATYSKGAHDPDELIRDIYQARLSGTKQE